MKIITCAGYFCTGSSAVTDFFLEFDNCSSVGDYEFRFLRDPDGIRDLEFKLIENNDRENTSFAIKRFIRYTDSLNGGVIRKGYKRFMDKNFKRFTNEYINNITELKSEVWWHQDQIAKGKVFHFIDLLFGKFCHIFNPIGRASLLKSGHEKVYFSAIDKEMFYAYTKEYVKNVLSCMNKKDSEFLMVDQLVPPSNINDYLKYFDDIKVIVVDRDPRDLYIIEKIKKWGNIPAKSVEEYCKWFEIIRRHRKNEIFDKEKVLFIRFEDLIYNYESTTAELAEFVGILMQNHKLPKTKLNPEISIKNTNLKVKYPKYKNDILYIEENLSEYLYDFPDRI